MAVVATNVYVTCVRCGEFLACPRFNPADPFAEQESPCACACGIRYRLQFYRPLEAEEVRADLRQAV